ncbi:MAG: hypothetical protein ACRDPK_07220 [Carbonactinosporaceae bacterium]
MDILRLVLIFLHFLGMASLLGGILVQLTAAEKRVVPAMIHGSLTQLVTGLALVGVDEAIGREFGGNAKVGVKLLVVLVIVGLVWVNRRRASVPTGTFAAIGGLTVLNVAVAVFWS